MTDIFISYASEDRNRVKALAHALEKKGWSVWWDQRIPIGRSYDEVIEEALDASKAVVVVWTNTSVKSQWVKNEAREGLRRRVLFPVMLLEVVKIPLEFRDVQAAHLMDWQPEQDHPGFDHFIDDIARLIGIPMNSSVQAPHIPVSQERSSSPASPTLESSLPKTAARVEPVRAALGENNNLSSLTLSPGTLNPAFAASTTDYTVNVASDVTSVTISASKADSNAVLSGCVTVGSATATGQATIPLSGPGTATLAVITVTAQNGSSKTYRIKVNRAALSGNNNLSMLTISPGSLSPAFKVRTLNYTVNVGSTVTSMAVTPKLQDTTAKMTVSGQVTESGQAQTIVLSGPGSNTLITIVVTAPNGTQKTYAVQVSRAALGGNNNLQSLSVSPGTLSPSFTASRTAYTVNLGDIVTNVTVTPTLQDTNSTMTINGQRTSVGQSRSIRLAPAGSSTEIEIIVTDPNGSCKTYLITVSRTALSPLADVTPEAEQLNQKPATEMADARPEATIESFTLQSATEAPGGEQESARLGEEHSRASTGKGHSIESFPYLSIGIVLLAAIGALVYFAVFSQGFSSGKRDEASVVKTITGNDGAPMVLVPAGKFMMGSREDDKSARDDEKPDHQVYLDAYYIDQYELTTSRYATFFRETKMPEPVYWSERVLQSHGNKPMVGVDWNDATAYCSWAGKRLPTEAEWEKAARGTDQRVYPWGNDAPNERRANFNRSENFDHYGVLTDVGAYWQGKSTYGIYDMAGNVWEWTADWYDESYYGKSPTRNPKGPSSAQYRVLRGGSWDNGPVNIRSADRDWHSPSERLVTLGFRCAQDIPK